MSRMGNEIARLRKEIGMTQSQLAKIVGVNEKFIFEVEAGRKVLNSDMIAKINKALVKQVGNLDIYEMEVAEQEPKPEPVKNVVKVIEKPVQAIWNDALSGVLMPVPVYNYTMAKALDTKQLPIISNKVEGFPKDKICYIEIQDNEMSGFRMVKGDRALALLTHDMEKDGIYLIKHNEKLVVRQLKKLDASMLLIVENDGSLKTLTVLKNSIKIMAKLLRLEVNL